jgi:hypothetical protein
MLVPFDSQNPASVYAQNATIELPASFISKVEDKY